MKNFFNKMAPKTLVKIMQECHQTNVDDLIVWCKDHSINKSDLIARYPELKNDNGLKVK